MQKVLVYGWLQKILSWIRNQLLTRQPLQPEAKAQDKPNLNEIFEESDTRFQW